MLSRQRVLLMLLAGSCGYHLGPAPSAISGVSLAPVVGLVGDPGLHDALAAALADAVAERGLRKSGPALSAELLAAEDRPLSVGADMQELQVKVRFSLATEPPRATTLSAREPYAVVPQDPLATERNRGAAQVRLLAGLSEAAVAELLELP